MIERYVVVPMGAMVEALTIKKLFYRSMLNVFPPLDSETDRYFLSS